MEKFFKLKERNTTVKTEIIGGLTTFFTMAYIIFVNPAIQGATGMNMVGVAVATCIAAVIGTLLTAFIANAPFAQAPGMGLNAFFTYTVCFGLGYTWQQALAIVLISGGIFFLIAISPIRSKIISSIPSSLKSAIGAGIGLFIAFIGLVDGGVVGFGAGVPAFNDITHGAPLLFVIGLIITVVLLVLKVKGSIFLGIIITALIGIVPSLCGWHVFGEFVTEGQAYSLSSIGQIKDVLFKFDFAGLGSHGVLALIAAILSFTIVDCFDTVGTLIGTAGNSGMLDEHGNYPQGDKALIADAIATCTGSCMGTSTVTTYVESAAGISAGARTGLSSIVVAILFALSLFVTPLFTVLSMNTWILYAAACPALVVVGVLMMKSVLKIAWDKLDEAIPCFLTIAVMPFAYSISEGISFGFISYTVIKLVTGKGKDVSVLMYILSLLFLARYILLNI